MILLYDLFFNNITDNQRDDFPFLISGMNVINLPEDELKAKQEAEANQIKTKSGCGCGQKHEGETICPKCEKKKEELSSLKKSELQDLAKENNFPEEEWKSLNKEPLIEYIAPKLVNLENK